MIWHNNGAEKVAEELSSDLVNGLSSQEAAERLEKYGRNELADIKARGIIRKFLDQIKNFMVIILLIAAVICTAIALVDPEFKPSDLLDPLIIIAIVILNACLGVLQESKAEKAFESLKKLSAPTAKVKRDGKVIQIAASEIVPGDIIVLEAGDFIPADARLITSHSLRCDESALTGESLPTEKNADITVDKYASVGDRLNMVYSACFVTYGRGLAMVTATGMDTETGKIAGLLISESETTTPLQRKLFELGKYLGILALIICAIIFITGLLTGGNIMDMLLFSVSLAVAAIPEGLPAVVTIVLALGVGRMIKKNAIVRKLPAVETLGCASVICTDKTGTLTLNKMTVVRAWTKSAGMVDIRENNSEELVTLLKMATLCTDGRLEKCEDGQIKTSGDPTETSIISAAYEKGLDKNKLETEYPRVFEIPFDSDRKLMTTVNVIEDKKIIIVKGAPDILLSKCINNTTQAEKANEEMAGQALRVIAIAVKVVDQLPEDTNPQSLENDLTLIGMVGMIDPPRPEIVEAVRTAKASGIRTIMITGDHVLTATEIGRQLGIIEYDDQAISGIQLSKMDDETLAENIDKYSVYARVSPEDKIRIVKAWQSKGEIVAMTGDGVNDAPALKAADIGCAMGITGTDVAKGASDLILTDDNYATIIAAVKEGRTIYDNIKKVVSFLLGCNLGEIFVCFAAMLAGWGIPVRAIQLLWINLVTDAAPALALSREKSDPDIMDRKPRPKTENILSKDLLSFVVFSGIMLGLLSLFAYWLGAFGIERAAGISASATGQTMAFAVLAFSQLIHAFNCRTTRSIFRVKLTDNIQMLLAIMLSGLLMAAVMFIPPISALFGLVSLSLRHWMYVIILSVAPVIFTEIYKLIKNR